MRSHRTTVIAAVALTLAPRPGTTADDAALTPRIERVALFKNGLGYFTSSTTLPDRATSIGLDRLPVPVHGTFWVDVSKAVKIRGLFTDLVEVKKQVPAADFIALLAANVGRRVRLNASADAPGIEGVVVSASPQAPKRPASPYLMGDRQTEDGAPPSSLVVIRTDRGLVMLSPGSIGRVDFDGAAAVTTTVLSTLRRPTVRVELEKPAAGETLRLSYLARGMTWSPSYSIDLSDAKTARLSASAVIVNEVADLENVRLELVTGFPNIQFADIDSPVAMSQSLEGFLSSLGQGRAEGLRRGPLTQQAFVLSNAAPFSEASPARDSAAATGRVAEDLFLYPIERLSLKRNETAYLPLFTADAPYKHIYTWRIGDLLGEGDRYRRDEQPRAEEVWHSARLTNPLSIPLTTAPAQFVSNGQFAGQDVCFFTAPGAETTIRINRAMNVVAERAEVEVDRKRSAATFYGSSYDLVKLKGELRLRNRMDKPASVEITKELSGEVGETEPKAQDTATVKGVRQVNTRHQLVWTIELQPGEARTLTYAYDVYIND